MAEETAVYSGVGSVFTFDKTTQAWAPADDGASGVFIYHHPVENTYRVIGVAQSTQQLNNDQFCSWRDAYTVNGVNLANKEQAAEFMQVLDTAVKAAQKQAEANKAASVPPLSTEAPPESVRTVPEAMSTSAPTFGGSEEPGPAVGLPPFLDASPGMPAPPVPLGGEAATAGTPATPEDGKGHSKREKKAKKDKKDKKDKETRKAEKQQRKEAREKQLKEALELEMASAKASDASSTSSDSLLESNRKTSDSPATSMASLVPLTTPKDGKPVEETKSRSGSMSSTPPPPPSLTSSQASSASSQSPLQGSTGSLIVPKTGESRLSQDARSRPMSVAFSAALDASSAERDLMVKEILVSEAAYVGQLDRLTNCADKMMADAKSKESPMDIDTVRLIFNNVKNIKMLNTKLSTNVKARLANWSPFAVFADIFQELLPYFKEYKTYAVGYMGGVKMLEAQLKVPKTEKYIRDVEKHTLEKGRELLSYMPLPIYRIGRYLLLLNQIFRRTIPDHPDYAILKAVVEKLPEFTNELQEVFRKTDSLKRTLALSKSSEFTKRMQTLMTEQRFVVYDDPNTTAVFGKGETRVQADHVLLFEEVLVFTSMKQGKEKKKKDLLVAIPLEYLWSLESKKEEAKPTQADYCSIAEGAFSISFDSNSSRVIFCATVSHYQMRLLTKRAIKTCSGDVSVNRFLSVRGEDGNDAEGYFERAKLHGAGKMTWKSGASFVGGWIDGRMSGQGKFTYKTGESLEGNWKDTAPHGKLIFTCPDGTYEGDWEMGVRHGIGVCKWANGDTYTGGFEKDLPHGQGVFQAKDGGKYEGDFKYFLRHGKGTLVSLSGTYTGDWVDDRREGQGTQKYPTGDEYVGAWKDDMRHGAGTCKSGDGQSVYEGEWAENKRNGKGKLVVKNDFTYEGEWKSDAKAGHGVITRVDGTSYEGRFKEDSYELQGKLKLPTGETYDGSWHNGKRSGKGVWVGPDGSKYDGEWYKDEKTGKGTLTYRDGSTYSGEWQQNMRQGTGTFTTKDNSLSYTGAWVADKRHGQGTQTDKFGKFDGPWKDDKPHGKGTYTLNGQGAVHEPTFQDGLRHGDNKFDGPRGAVVVRYQKGALATNQQPLDVIDSLFAPPMPRTFLKM